MVKRNRKGFTIIEVVLVLAIAGLIFAMVFIALPSLQRGQRNTERKRDLSLIVSAMNTWYRNNKSSVSDNFSKRDQINGFCTFYKRYVGADLNDPSTGQPYKVILWKEPIAVDCINDESYARENVQDPSINAQWKKMEIGDIQFINTALCGDGETVVDEGDVHDRNFVIRMLLEGGGIACIDAGNQENPHLQSFTGEFYAKMKI